LRANRCFTRVIAASPWQEREPTRGSVNRYRAIFDVALYEPEIPPNTGNVIRLCANTGARLHLIRPLGFRLDARSVRRAGLDYDALAEVRIHESWHACLAAVAPPRWFAISTRGLRRYDAAAFERGDLFLFGPETRGLPDEVLESCPAECRLTLPMRPGSRSLNLANAAAVVVYEAWRQQDFAGALNPART
jgi:tRNA (cytidine/uridine-2'-O-)-methyltransferase